MVTVASSARAGVAIKAAQIAILAAHLIGFIEISSRADRFQPAVPPLLTSEPMISKAEASRFRHVMARPAHPRPIALFVIASVAKQSISPPYGPPTKSQNRSVTPVA
jgi:hypothetical protein